MIYIRALSYLNYTIMSHHKKGHGIHSPFVFDVVSRIFRNKIDPAIVLKVEQTRKKMLSNKRSISINDLGAGSGKLKQNVRKISEIALHSPVTPKYGRLLSNIAAEFGEPLIIELGTSLGISTLYMAASCKDAEICTIEGCSETASIARENFLAAGQENIRIFEGSFDEILPGLMKKIKKPGLVFIDGNHKKEPVIKYFNEIASAAGNDTVVIIDDINYSKGMAEAWNELKHHPGVSVTIDVFRMGILFFRQGISPNNYIIRY
jgi:predicted O-methyltransferase YrrM